MTSLGTMLEQLAGMRDTRDLSPWENGFVTDVYSRYLIASKRTSVLSPAQAEKIEQIWSKHFA